MGSPTVRLQPSCPCCGQGLRRGWQLQQRWGQFVEFAGRGRITPQGFVPLDAPPPLVQQAASMANWATPPEAIVSLVWSAANTLVRAGWGPVVAAPPTSVPPTPWSP